MVGGKGLPFSDLSFGSGSGSVARVTPPLFLAATHVRAVSTVRCELLLMEWFLATLRRTNELTCFGQRGTESARATGSDQVVKNGGYPLPKPLLRDVPGCTFRLKWL